MEALLTDAPRFVLLSVNHADIIGSFVHPDDDCWKSPGYTADPNAQAEAAAVYKRVEAMSDEDVKWVADNQLEVGGIGAVDLRVIQDMAAAPDREVRTLCARLGPLWQALTDAEVKRAGDALFGYAPFGETPEDLETVLLEIEPLAMARAADGQRGREGAHPVHLLTRAQLLEVVEGFTREGELRLLWEDASDAELHCLCRLEDAFIRQGDDTVEEIYWTACARLGVKQ